MPRSLNVEVDPRIFRWLRESSGWTIEDVGKRLGTSSDAVVAIESGERKPTLWQLKELSRAYKRPVASFFLSEPVPEPPLPKDYRILPDRRGVFDRKTIYTIRRARNLQELGSELSGNLDYSIKPKVGRATIHQEPEDLAASYRIRFGLTEERQRRFRSSYALFEHLRDNLEELNILVFQFPMPMEDARGFALTDKTPNVIVVNSRDSIEARSFSLMHEFGHVLLGETVIDLPDISASVKDTIEKWCNMFASNFLLPKELAMKLFKSERRELTDGQTLNSLSKRYKVSKAMLLYNMHEMGFISRREYQVVLDRYRPPESKEEEIDEGAKGKDEEKATGWGVPAHKRCLSEIGNKFVSIVAHNYDNSYITYNDALDYLSIRSGNFEKVLSKARK